MELDDNSFHAQYENAQIRVSFDTGIKKYNSKLDLSNVEIRKELENVFIKSLQRSANSLSSLLGVGPGDPPFLVKSDEKGIVVAAAQGLFGKAKFIFAFPSGYGTGVYSVEKGTDPKGLTKAEGLAVYKETAMKLLSTIEMLEDASPAPSDHGGSVPLLVSELAYTQNRRANVGNLSVPIPDGTVYAMGEANDEVDTVIPETLRKDKDFICVPETDARDFSTYQDASISIFLGKTTFLNNLEQAWNTKSVDDVAKLLVSQFEGSFNKQAMTEPLKIVHKEKGFMSCYGLYSGDDAQEGFWRSYGFYIVNIDTFVCGMFYFNQKASNAEFEAVVKHWLSEVYPISDEGAEKAAVARAKEQFGPYGAENGKLDAIRIARLFAEDVLFFPETPRERKDNKLNLDLQFNMAKLGDHPFIVQNTKPFFPALEDLFVQLDRSNELLVPKNRLHQKMLKPLLDDRLTGLSFLNLMAYHMVKITEKDDEKDNYMVIVDRNVIAGIPDAYHYICKFIKFAREYNERTGVFSVQFVSAINYDSPISDRLSPVTGAATGASMWECTVTEDGTILDGHRGSQI